MDALQALARGAAPMTAFPIVTVDIVVSVHNAADDLRRCVDSVLARTSGDYRLLLIDDASSDPAIRNYFDELRAVSATHLTCCFVHPP